MGRRYRHGAICEVHESIDIRNLHRRGLLRPGLSFPYSWSRDGEPCGSINVRTLLAGAILSFCVRHKEGDQPETITQNVPIAFTVCNFGGYRPWFCCTADAQRCGRRVAVLYLGENGVFACRRCYGLTYASQLEPLRLRGLAKARKLRMKMGGGPNIFDDFPRKPKGMHWRTYDRLRHVYQSTVARF
jgi:hypothetical protein